MLIIGLTGGLACGKSLVAEQFRALGAHVLDTDLMARELVMPGQASLAAIREHFGAAVIHSDGTLNRAALRSRIFADPAAKAWLEALLHPPIRELLRVRSAAIGRQEPDAVVIQVVPLLFESGGDRQVDRILVVDCDPELQYQRALARGGWQPAEVRAAIATQCSREVRLAHADDVIDNNGTPTYTHAQVAALMARYRALAQQATTKDDPLPHGGPSSPKQ